MEYGAFSLLPPIIAIVLAIFAKDVIISLMLGIFSGFLILKHFHFGEAFVGMFDSIVHLFAEGWITKTVIFALLVGSVIKLIIDSGGVDGFVEYLTKKHIKSKKGALLLAYVIGLVIFIESSITSLVAGTVAKPLTDKFGVSREKLAYVCDSTSAPVCSLIPFNGWGALLIGLITAQISAGVITGNAVDILIKSIPLNFYSIITLIMVLYFILSGKDFGPMKKAESIAVPKEFVQVKNAKKGNMIYMIAPIVMLIALMPAALYLSGGGDILKGSGSTSVFYSVIITLMFTYLLYIFTGAMSHKAYFESFFEGIGEMVPIVTILILAFAIGAVIKDLGTAKYIASVASGAINPIFIPAVIFILSAIIAFSTGTSWGTFSIMMPIAIAYAASSGIYIPLAAGAVISGGIFGDHSSPISDTTIISSMASGCEHINHVNTQLPYALLGGVLATAAFIVAAVFI